MTDRDEALQAIRQQAGGIDPQVDQALNYSRGVRAMRDVVREQGQVMSATLANNHTLYHTNKKLTEELREARGARVAAERELQIERDERALQVEALEKQIAELQANGGDRFRGMYDAAMRTLNAYLFAELDSEQLKERLEEMKAQAQELAANPDVVTPSELGAAGYSVPLAGEWGQHPEAEKARLEASKE